MSGHAEFHELIECLIERDEPIQEGKMERFRKSLSDSLDRSRRRLQAGTMAFLAAIPVTIVGLLLCLGASRQPPAVWEWLAYPGMVLAFGGMIVLLVVPFCLLLWYLPRYLSARRDLRDSMLALLIRRVDELSARVEAADKAHS